MRLTAGMALVLIVVAGLLGSCATVPASREDKAALVAAATSRLQQMSTADPALRVLIQQGYSLAPSSLSVLARVAVSRVTTPRTSHGAAEGRDARRPIRASCSVSPQVSYHPRFVRPETTHALVQNGATRVCCECDQSDTPTKRRQASQSERGVLI